MRRRKIAFTIILITVFTVGGFQMLQTQEGSEVTGFGESTARAEPYAAFFDSACSDFRKFLVANGFTVSSKQPYGAGSGVHSGREKNEYYLGKFNGSRPFSIILRIPQGDACGIDASVSWLYRGFNWNVEADGKKARGFADVLTAWWDDYKIKHPLKSTLPGTSGSEASKE